MYARIYTYAYDTHVYKYVYYNSYTTQVSVTAVGGGGGGARLVPDGIYVRILQHIRTYTTYMYTIRTYNTMCAYVYCNAYTAYVRILQLIYECTGKRRCSRRWWRSSPPRSSLARPLAGAGSTAWPSRAGALKSQFPYKFVNLSLIVTDIQNKLTDFCGN